MKKMVLTIFCLLIFSFAYNQSWLQLTPSPPIPASTNLLGIHFVTDDIGFVAGTQGSIFKSVDGGNNWSQVLNVTGNFYSVYFIDTKTGFAVGDAGLIKTTEDGGLTWPNVALPASAIGKDFRRVWFLNAYTGFIVGGVSGSSGLILRTKDGGKTWEDISPALATDAIYGIYFLDQNNGYACDYTGKIYKTTNGNALAPSVLWGQELLPPVAASYHLSDVQFFDPNFGIAIGFDQFLATSIILEYNGSSGGWTPTPILPNILTDVKIYKDYAYAVGGNSGNLGAMIYKRNNIPISAPWNLQQIIPLSGPVSALARQYRVSIPSSNTAFACGLGGTVLKIKPKTCCDDFMTDAMDYGILGNGISGNTYQFCLSPNISPGDVFQWDMNCDGSIEQSTPCATYNLVAGNTMLCVTILHINPGGDTCRVKLNTCLPEIIKTDSCLCDTSFYQAVQQCYTISQNSSLNYTFTPNALLDNCDAVIWTFGDGTSFVSSSGSQPVTHTFSSAGNHTVCMIVARTDINGQQCKRECCLPIVVTAVKDPHKSLLTVTPNPLRTDITITIPDSMVSESNTIRLMNTDGKIMLIVPASSQHIKLDIENFASGIYYLTMSNKSGALLQQAIRLAKID